MAKRSVGNTAVGAAVCRLIEQYQPPEKLLCSDPIIKDLLGQPYSFLMGFAPMRTLTVNRTEAALKGLYGSQVCRARYIDDVVQGALSGGIRQLVILGAGYDTRAYRLPNIEAVKVFEVDLPHVQDDKKAKLQRHFERLPANVTYVPIDFDTQTLDSVFAGTTFDSSKPAVFVWEGVTQYITEAAVRQTLTFVDKSAASSVLVFTYVLKSVIERRSDIPGADKMLDFVGRSSPWLFGLEPSEVQSFIQPYHLKLIEDMGNREYQTKYLQPIHRDLAYPKSSAPFRLL
jgi:methyltransferase (TIGR00027 family)